MCVVNAGAPHFENVFDVDVHVHIDVSLQDRFRVFVSILNNIVSVLENTLFTGGWLT